LKYQTEGVESPFHYRLYKIRAKRGGFVKFKKIVVAGGLAILMTIGVAIESNAQVEDGTFRLRGRDRYETAALVAEKYGSYNTAILINSDKSLADGLSASGLAGYVKAPILLTKKDSIPSVTSEKLNGVSKVYIIGGTSSVSSKVEENLSSRGIDVIRVSGNDRVQTSYNVCEKIKETNEVDRVFIANGFKGEADAMSIAQVAAKEKTPIILTDGNNISNEYVGIRSFAIGGKSSVSDSLVSKMKATRIGGNNRFETNKNIINYFYGGKDYYFVTNGYNLVDALTASTIADDIPIVLTSSGSDKGVIKKAEGLAVIGGLDENVVDECVNITRGIGSSNSGYQSIKDQALRFSKFIYGTDEYMDYSKINNNMNYDQLNDYTLFLYPNTTTIDKKGAYYAFGLLDPYAYEVNSILLVNSKNASEIHYCTVDDNLAYRIASPHDTLSIARQYFVKENGREPEYLDVFYGPYLYDISEDTYYTVIVGDNKGNYKTYAIDAFERNVVSVQNLTSNKSIPSDMRADNKKSTSIKRAIRPESKPIKEDLDKQIDFKASK
jgi:putative cell wall-binding protein